MTRIRFIVQSITPPFWLSGGDRYLFIVILTRAQTPPQLDVILFHHYGCRPVTRGIITEEREIVSMDDTPQALFFEEENTR